MRAAAGEPAPQAAPGNPKVQNISGGGCLAKCSKTHNLTKHRQKKNNSLTEHMHPNAAQHPMTFSSTVNLLTNVLNHGDVSEIFLDCLNYQTVLNLSKVSKVINKLCDFRALLERKTVRFVHGKTYVSTTTGWYNRIHVLTIERKSPCSKTVSLLSRPVTNTAPGIVFASRKRVRLEDGVESVMLDRNWKMGCIYAKDLHSPKMDANIESENLYWNQYK